MGTDLAKILLNLSTALTVLHLSRLFACVHCKSNVGTQSHRVHVPGHMTVAKGNTPLSE